MATAKLLWTTDNKDTALNMLCLYGHNAKLQGWMDEVEILVWGASQNLIARDTEVQAKVKAMINDGVKITACKKCAENMGVEQELSSCSIEVYYTGKLLSEWIKSGESIITV